MASEAEVRAMHRALRLAASSDAPQGPNPRVGCVLLDSDGGEIAVGYHRGAGSAHAEVDALTRAGSRAQGATAVVTLEPCNHTGRTGPCAEALIEAGVARVVFAQPDPSRLAAGGAQRLRETGIDVESGVLEPAARDLNPEWTFHAEHDRPFVTYKVATSIDGRVAAADGTSRWITSGAARRDVHRLRAQADAIAVGTGTVLADDPRLTVRDEHDRPVPHQPIRVVVGKRSIPKDAAIWADPPTPVIMPTRDPHRVVDALNQRGINHVWLEGGPRLGGAFLAAGLIDRLVVYTAPVLLGAGPAAIEQAGIATLADAPRWQIVDVTQVGEDVRLTAQRRGSGFGAEPADKT